MSSLPPYHPDQPEPSLSVSWDDSCPVTSDRDVLQAMSTSESVEVVHRERPPLKRERLAPLRSSNSQATDGKVSAPHGGDMSLPPVILGCAAFGYNIYAKEDDVMSDLPLKLVKQALDAGVSAFDTSPHYHPSEIVLGHALRALAPMYPRESYRLITKAGKYGEQVAHHVYDPEVIRKSVDRSLKRLGTSYLDVVYLHDVEFLSSDPFPSPPGQHLMTLKSSSDTFNLTCTEPLGSGDRAILSCFAVLRQLQHEGVIRLVGLAGYPLPTLLRLCRLIRATSGLPVDIVQTYAHQTVLCSTLAEGFLQAFEAAGVGQVVNAAPLAMGMLTTSGGPAWHPAREQPVLIDAIRAAVELLDKDGWCLEDIASGFGLRELQHSDGRLVPVVIGCKSQDELESALKIHALVNGEQGIDGQGEERRRLERRVRELFERMGVRNTSWQSPSPSLMRQMHA